MELLNEEFLVYVTVFLLCGLVVFLYLRQQSKISRATQDKVSRAKEEGLFEPVSLHPYIDLNVCIGSAACVSACPEKDIIGISDGKATLINSSNCVGHGACFHSCPVEAISLRIGTESRGVELPHVNQNYETNVGGIYIAGELGGMGLIRNSVEQGRQAIDSIVKSGRRGVGEVIDVAIIGAGPAGISATLACKKNGLSSITLEQESLGGTVFTFPRSKVVMTSPMELPLYGKVKLYDTSKEELLNLWKEVISKHDITIKENTKVESIIPQENKTFKLTTKNGDEYIAANVLIAIGRRGSPRKLNIPGEDSTKVAYRLLEPEQISGEHVVVVGGGDSAMEAAMLLMQDNDVTLLVRSDKFTRSKPKNRENAQKAIDGGKMKVVFNSSLMAINPEDCIYQISGQEESVQLKNDRVYIFAGGVMPTAFLERSGIQITKRFGHIMKKHGS